jgi:hypothetical protein
MYVAEVEKTQGLATCRMIRRYAAKEKIFEFITWKKVGQWYLGGRTELTMQQCYLLPVAGFIERHGRSSNKNNVEISGDVRSGISSCPAGCFTNLQKESAQLPYNIGFMVLAKSRNA